MVTYLRLFEDSNPAQMTAAKVEDEAKKCAILAIRVPEIINFEEVLALKAFTHFQQVYCFYPNIYQKNKEVYDFLNLFKTSSAKDFGGQVIKFKAILETEGLTIEDAIQKKSYIEVCKLELEKSSQSYQDLSNLLNVRSCL
jgi:hypothetical protein